MQYFVYAVQYIYMMSVCIVFHLGSAQALQNTVQPLTGIDPLWMYSVGVFIICFPLCMVRMFFFPRCAACLAVSQSVVISNLVLFFF